MERHTQPQVVGCTGVGLEATPDPFDDRIEISYLLPCAAALVSLRVYDVEGREVRSLLSAAESGARGEVVWDGTWSDGYSGSASGVTAEDGTVSFASGKVKAANVTFTFTVDGVAKGGYTYDPALNIETSDSITVP